MKIYEHDAGHMTKMASLGRGDESLFAHLCHLTKMATMPIYGKIPLRICCLEPVE